MVVTSELFSTKTADHYVRTMTQGIDVLARHLAAVDSPTSGRTPADVEPVVRAVDLDAPLHDVGAALSELERVYLEDAVWFHDPGYAAHLNCPVVVPALLAELFVSSVNSSLDTWDQSGGATFVERHLVDWTTGRLGLGPDADGVFTSGGTQSNLQALLMARGQTFLTGDVDPGETFAAALSRFRIFASGESHFSVRKSATLLGLGQGAVTTVATDERRRLDPDALDIALDNARAQGLVPMAVVATAGTTDFGVVDPLPEIAEVCRRHGVWLHVDGAYGGGLMTSLRYRHLLDGIEHADSVTVDYHKTFFQPVSASAVLVRHADTLRHVTYHADYLNPRTANLPNQVDKSLQTTRRFDALKLWLTLRVMGADQVGEYLDATLDLARATHEMLALDPELEVAAEPVLSTLVLRYRPQGVGEALADDVNPRIRTALAQDGRFMVAGTVADGRRWLKLTLLNPETTPADVARILDAVREKGRELLDDLHAFEEVGR